MTMAPAVPASIANYQSQPVISNCRITKNWTSWYGGGIRCSQSAPMIRNCTIADNKLTGSLGSAGGGVCCYESDATLLNCTITGNWVEDPNGAGGGVYCWLEQSKRYELHHPRQRATGALRRIRQPDGHLLQRRGRLERRRQHRRRSAPHLRRHARARGLAVQRRW